MASGCTQTAKLDGVIEIINRRHSKYRL